MPGPSAESQIEVNNATELTVKPVFTERPVWHTVGNGWRHLHGSVSRMGVSFEWHDFTVSEELNWGRSFHPGSIEVCLNREETDASPSTTAKLCSRR